MAFVPLSETKRNQFGRPKDVTRGKYEITWIEDALINVFQVILNGQKINLKVHYLDDSSVRWLKARPIEKLGDLNGKTIEDIIKMGKIDTYKFNRSGNISKSAYLLAFLLLSFSLFSIYFLQL